MEHSTGRRGSDTDDSPPQIRVLIVDDEALMRAGIRLMIDGASAGSSDDECRIAVVGEAADGAGALDAARTLDPDVILMDIRMPGMNGVEATRVLQAAGTRARIIMLTAFDTDEFILDALGGGAVSFLLKDSAPALVLAAVRDASAGEPRLSPSVMTRLVELANARPAPGSADSAAPGGAGVGRGGVPGGDATVDSERTPESVPGAVPAPAGVTPREWEVALFIAQGVSNKDIATALYISVSTVKTHLASLSAKLHVINRTQIAMRVGELSSPLRKPTPLSPSNGNST